MSKFYLILVLMSLIMTACKPKIEKPMIEDDEIADGHEWVDLGLPSGLKWATCNVGASTPEEYGDYFAWGETNPKKKYLDENSITYGQEMEDFSGDIRYDAATANWGGTWRVPTKDEIKELKINCEWTMINLNDVNGYLVTGPNDNTIFLPAAGYRIDSLLFFDGTQGCYWSSSPYNYNNEYAYFLYINSDWNYNYNIRIGGYNVRPVCDSK